MQPTHLFRNYITLLIALLTVSPLSADEVVWQIGNADNSAAELCLGEGNYNAFLENDFGFEDRFFVIGHSEAKRHFAYVLPGPKDQWAGTGIASGWRTHDANILFTLKRVSSKATATLRVDLIDVHPEGCSIRVKVNNKTQRYNLKGTSLKSVEGDYSQSKEILLSLPLEAKDLRKGDNIVTISVLEGSWAIFDQVRLEGNNITLASKKESEHLLQVRAAEYDLNTSPRKHYRTPADYVDTRMGSAHSRWMIAPGPWMPFSMVKLSPDNQNRGWQAGYQPTLETVGCMSHIHEWTMAGLGTMPTNGKLFTHVGDETHPDEGYRSRIDKQTEKAPLGYYSVRLTDTDILLEASATTRASIQRYTFPTDRAGRVMIDLHVEAEYDYQLKDVEVIQVGTNRIEGRSHQLTPRVWSDDAHQDYTLCFVMEFSAPIQRTGYWKNDSIFEGTSLRGSDLTDAGMYVEFDTRQHPVVTLRTGISFVSIQNAALNLQTEISQPFGWNLEAVVKHQREVWNDILSRVEITTPDTKEKVRFYTNLYRSMCRNCFNDVNGDWMAPDETIHRLPNPSDDYALGCDAFWNTFWNLNQVWNLITPEWSSRWVRSQLSLYDACGWIAKGPAGMEYIPVMVAEHEIPQMVSAWQMGIRDFNPHHALEAMVHQQTTPATHIAGGFAGNRDLIAYLRYHYVPCDIGRFSNTLEYSFDDWAVAQMARSIGNDSIYRIFSERGEWWTNAINPDNGYAHMRDSKGHFVEPFDPMTTGANHHYVEGNAWQLSYFAPQDPRRLIAIQGREAFVRRLDEGFRQSEPLRYNAPNDYYWNYPVCHGNQQSMHFAFLFNWAGEPALTQQWTRSIIDRYYGYGQANAYLGDEDQGQMSAWFVMAAMGLFQTDGGCNATPVYELTTPLYERIVIHLDGRYGRGKTFTINAPGASKNRYIRSATLNGKPLNDFYFPASELLRGGTLNITTTENKQIDK
ncbi:MAG: GH92 family glycosyl hydrolase [Prevotella sp.]|nr:GH92 family glycosyl hydrolase [Prevotella sp.]